ncbi:MAG: Hpt domain-containing protein [Treponema sp.]|uniref:Hpt domain-containing protein n=2 Tax=Treponema sp. TaxID=166 RepID=UPI001D2C4903|nr:Hpt domain-containing protein [Treponema sp.]MBS7241069.1 Hpt domain-containing protein [Treponema sp.]
MSYYKKAEWIRPSFNSKFTGNENMETFNRTLALEMVGDEAELLQELERSFVYDKIFDIKTLENLEATDKLEAAAYVHSFKGAARQIAAEKAAFSGQKLEDVLRGKAQGDLKELNSEFSSMLSEAIEIIRKDIE